MNLKAEIAYTQRVVVMINVERYCAFYKVERAEFDGSDEEFVREGVSEEAYDILQDPSGADGGVDVVQHDLSGVIKVDWLS